MRRIAMVLVLCWVTAACQPAARTGAAPSPSPMASPSGAASSPSGSPTPESVGVPAGFGPLSATFVSERRGWVLGVVDCPGGRCVALLQTADGGATWSAAGAPPVPPAPAAGALAARRVRFANEKDGWVFGPRLWSTHDAGAHWAPVELPEASSDAAVASLEAASGRVHAALLGGPKVRVESSPVGAEQWRAAAVDLSVGAGPVPQAQLVLQRDAGWLVVVNRTVAGGARLVRGAWSAWDPPCLDAGGPAVLASSRPDDLVAVCNEGLWTGPEVAVRAYVSADAGSTFRRLPKVLPKGSDGDVGRPGARSIVVAGSTDAGAPLLNATFDAGATWHTVWRGRQGQVLRDLGFTTASQGIAVATAGEGAGGLLLMTHDGGRTWAPVSFSG